MFIASPTSGVEIIYKRKSSIQEPMHLNPSPVFFQAKNPNKSLKSKSIEIKAAHFQIKAQNYDENSE